MAVLSPAEGMLTLLKADNIATDGVVTNTNWKAFIGIYQSEPHNCVTLRDTGGLESNPRYLLDEKTVQIIIRGKVNGYAEAYAKARQVKDCLLRIDPQNVGDDRWNSIIILSDIAFIGNDNNDRPMLTLNLRVIIEPATNVITHRVPL